MPKKPPKLNDKQKEFIAGAPDGKGNPKKKAKKKDAKSVMIDIGLGRTKKVLFDELPWLTDYVKQNPTAIKSQPLRLPIRLKHKLEFVSGLGYGSQNQIVCDLLESYLDKLITKHGIPLK